MDILMVGIFLLMAVAFLACAGWLLNNALLQLLGRYPYDAREDTDD